MLGFLFSDKIEKIDRCEAMQMFPLALEKTTGILCAVPCLRFSPAHLGGVLGSGGGCCVPEVQLLSGAALQGFLSPPLV